MHAHTHTRHVIYAHCFCRARSAGVFREIVKMARVLSHTTFQSRLMCAFCRVVHASQCTKGHLLCARSLVNMTDFAYCMPMPIAQSMSQLLRHNYADRPEQAERLEQCDVARHALVQYLQQNADLALGQCRSTSQHDGSTSHSQALALAKSTMDHHIHVATLSNSYVCQWRSLVDEMERAGASALTLCAKDHGLQPLFSWTGSASLQCKTVSPHQPVVSDSCMRFETIMALVCATLAYLNSTMAMRSYTVLATHALNTTANDIEMEEDATRRITADLLAANKCAVIYALEAQQQLQLFRLAPANSLAELRPRVLEALASYATYCMQQMALPKFLELKQRNEPGAMRQLCAMYMGLAAMATTTAVGASGAVEQHDGCRDMSHLELVGQMGRAHNLIQAALLRANALVDEAHECSQNGEATRAHECLRGARLLTLFANTQAHWCSMCIKNTAQTCPLVTENYQEVSKRWRAACEDRLLMWQDHAHQYTERMLERTSEAMTQIMPAGWSKDLDRELLHHGMHEVARWLPQHSTQLQPEEMAQRLWQFLSDVNGREYAGAQSLLQLSGTTAAVREAVRHVTGTPAWTLPIIPSLRKTVSAVDTQSSTGQEEHVPSVQNDVVQSVPIPSISVVEHQEPVQQLWLQQLPRVPSHAPQVNEPEHSVKTPAYAQAAPLM